MAKVSIVVPTFNGGAYLEQTLEAVFAQTFRDIEVIISDDASSDNTLQVVSAFNDQRLRTLDDRSHAGPAGNWNRALAAAEGEFVKVLAQDDLIYPNNLSVQVAALEANPEASFAAVKRDVVGSDGTVLMRDRGLSGLCGTINRTAAARRIVRTGANQFGEGSAVLVRRQAAVAVGWFDGSLPYAIDVDYWVRLLSWGPVVGICQSHAAFRVSAQSWSNSLVREQGRQYSELIDRIASNSANGVAPTDVTIGKARAGANALARKAFYWRHRRHV